ncbi:MAG: hypothetical protein ACQERF_00170 [Actinomycetota bacterium]
MKLSLVADREFPEHLIADTEQALKHLGWAALDIACVVVEPHPISIDGALSGTVATLPTARQAFVRATGGPRDAVHVAGSLLGVPAV